MCLDSVIFPVDNLAVCKQYIHFGAYHKLQDDRGNLGGCTQKIQHLTKMMQWQVTALLSDQAREVMKIGCDALLQVGKDMPFIAPVSQQPAC